MPTRKKREDRPVCHWGRTVYDASSKAILVSACGSAGGQVTDRAENIVNCRQCKDFIRKARRD